jgi:hypothetical protein
MINTKDIQNKPKPQTYVVDDPTFVGNSTQFQPSFDDRLSQFNTQQSSSMVTKLPERKPSNTLLEKLIFIGRLTEYVELNGVKFEIGTLTNKEHTEIVRLMYSFTKPADLFMVRIITLAHAIRSIDDIPLDSIHVDGQFESDLHRKMSIIDNLQLSVIEKLYNVYEKLTSSDALTKSNEEVIKNS